jgi:hypothetical protein
MAADDVRLTLAGEAHEYRENEAGDPVCPACGHYIAMWADDGEANDADWWECEPFDGGCGRKGAVVWAADLRRTLNGVEVK